MDGLSVVAPTGDPTYAELRGDAALSLSGSAAGRDLGAGYVLHPALKTLGQLYQRGDALLIHAASTPYRGRSHFDGQDVLESGLGGVGSVSDGWLNRAMQYTEQRDVLRGDSFSVGPMLPTVMKGRAPVMTWSPPIMKRPVSNALTASVAELYAATDPALAAALAQGLAMEELTNAMPEPVAPAASVSPRQAYLANAASAAASLMSAPSGPRIGALTIGGWDTHVRAGIFGGTFQERLEELDAVLTAFVGTIGEAWSETTLVFATEFGRTAEVNGSDGTDHGTGTVAIVAGGNVRGGRVLADWPGLAPSQLLDGRDLMPTIDLRSVFKGVLRDHVGLPDRVLDTEIFPDSADIRAVKDLVV